MREFECSTSGCKRVLRDLAGRLTTKPVLTNAVRQGFLTVCGCAISAFEFGSTLKWRLLISIRQ